MVKSGLDEKLQEEGKVPRVSQYRLAAHLGTAFLVYLASLKAGWIALDMSRAKQQVVKQIRNPQLRKFKGLSTGTVHLAFLTAISGSS